LSAQRFGVSFLVAGLLLFPAALTFARVAGAQSAAIVTPAPGSAAIVTPAPGGAMWSTAETAALRRYLDALLASAPALKEAHVGVLAVATGSGDVLYARNADDAFAPASTLKLLVGSVALDELGADDRFWTAATLEPGSDGAGVLTLSGFGDPLLAAGDLDGLAAAVAAKGGRVGAVAVDATLFGDTSYPDGWTWDDFGEDYAARSSATTVEENVVHVHLRLDANGAVTASAAPLSDVFAAAAAAADTGAAPPARSQPDCRADGGFIVVRAKAKPGAQSDVDARVDGPCVVLDGVLGNDPTDIDVAVPDPPLYVGRIVLQALAARGVDLGGAALERVPLGRGLGASRAPAGGALVLHSGLWSHRSPSLGEFLGPHFWIPSDNLVGETLLFQLALSRPATPATRAAGFEVERDWLRSIGVDPASATLADGCGMSQYDRITPRALVAILQHDWRGPNRWLVLDSLPVGGARGTIEGIAGSDAAGRVFAKTGSMMHVRGLAGYLATKRHGAVTFAFNVDDWIGDYAALAKLRAQVLSRIVDD
jgi:D-alanyl-D-alanine carboxypeptidase/D-alanyl-D-alanine-endopeptidase (penicillin-binding protein 4)